MYTLDNKFELQEELSEYKKKLSELKMCISLNEKQVSNIDCEINRLNKEISILESKKKKTLSFCDKVIAVAALLVTTPILLKIVYKFVAFLGIRFIETASIVSKCRYAFFTLFGGGLIIFLGPIIIREGVNILVKISSNMIINSSKYKSIDDELEKIKKKVNDLNLSKCIILKEKSDIVFEYSKYSALVKLREWLLNNNDIDLIIDDENYETDEMAMVYTRKRKKDDFVLEQK